MSYVVVNQFLTLPHHFHNVINSPEFSQAPLQLPSKLGIVESKETLRSHLTRLWISPMTIKVFRRSIRAC
jgi:hypothetical protein